MNLVSGNRGHGIAMKGAGVTDNLVAGNFVGTNLAGDIALPNAVNGININQGANGNTVGDANRRSAIVTFVAGNNGQGINIAGAGTSGNTVDPHHRRLEPRQRHPDHRRGLEQHHRWIGRR